MTHRGFGWRHNYAMINNIQMHYVEQAAESASGSAGDRGTVVLCHGFPMLWFSWHRQIPVLAAAGYRVIAPSMRGMGQSEAPEEPEAYGVDEITADLVSGRAMHRLLQADVGAGKTAVALYAMLQRTERDPLPWGGNTVDRVAGHRPGGADARRRQRTGHPQHVASRQVPVHRGPFRRAC